MRSSLAQVQINRHAKLRFFQNLCRQSFLFRSGGQTLGHDLNLIEKMPILSGSTSTPE